MYPYLIFHSQLGMDLPQQYTFDTSLPQPSYIGNPPSNQIPMSQPSYQQPGFMPQTDYVG